MYQTLIILNLAILYVYLIYIYIYTIITPYLHHNYTIFTPYLHHNYTILHHNYTISILCPSGEGQDCPRGVWSDCRRVPHPRQELPERNQRHCAKNGQRHDSLPRQIPGYNGRLGHG